MLITELRQLTDRIWIFPHDPDPNKIQPNVGIITTEHHTILVDGGNCPRTARRILGSLDEINAPPMAYVIYTHSHWDHVFGAQVFGVPTIAHDLCRKNLVETAAKPWSYSYLQEEIQRNPAREMPLRVLGRAIEDWRSFRVIVPEITVTHLLRLHLDDTTIEIEHVGGQHAADSVVVRVKEAGVIFLSDCYYPPPIYQRAPEDTLDWRMIESLVRDDISIYVDGHGDPRTREEMLQLAAEVKQGHAS